MGVEKKQANASQMSRIRIERVQHLKFNNWSQYIASAPAPHIFVGAVLGADLFDQTLRRRSVIHFHKSMN